MHPPSPPPTRAPCPCGNDKTYRQCCAPLHWGLQQAETAEQLVRSRYSAAFHGITDYLVTSLYPPKRLSQPLPDASSVSPPPIQWQHLRIIDIRDGTAEDTEGSVEFVATYRRGDSLRQLRERSELVREGGRWYYVEGEVEDRALPSPSRNAPCWCGSGRKLKTCHGRAPC